MNYKERNELPLFTNESQISNQNQSCEHKWIGSNVAGIVNCLFCGETKDLTFKSRGDLE